MRSSSLLLLAALCACAEAEPAAPTPPAPGPAAVSGGPACAPGVWCWVHGATIRDMATAEGSLFAVGARGTVLEWTERGFRRHSAFTDADLISVWMAGPRDVWVVSQQSEVFRYDGASWSQLAAVGRNLRGSAKDDVWLDTQRFDGAQFRENKPETLGWFLDLLAVARDDVWLLGLLKRDEISVDSDNTVLFHYDGQRWTQQGGRIPGGLWGARLTRVGGELWAHGVSTYRYDGAQWHEQKGPYGLDAWRNSGTNSPPLPETIALLDGQGITQVPAHTQCAAARRLSASESFCFSPDGQLYRLDGSQWRRAPADPYGDTLSAEHWGKVPPALWASGARLAWGAGPNDVYRVAPPDPTALEIEPLRLEHYDGKRWRELARGQFVDIAASAADDVWFVGKPLLHWDGRTLQEVTLPAELADAELSDAVSFGARGAWFVAYRPEPLLEYQVLRYDGHRWSVEYSSSRLAPDATYIEDIAGSSPEELYLLAIRQPILRYEGSAQVVHHDGAQWRTSELWQTWGVGEIVLDRDRLWITDAEGVASVSLAELGGATALARPTTTADPEALGGSISSVGGRLWVGPSDLWLTTPTQAMRLPFPANR